MRALDVPAGHGWLWIKQGYALFRKAPLMWWVILSLWFLGYLLLRALFGAFGEVAFSLVYPTLSAGLMLGCRALDSGEELEASHIAAGFRNNFRQLLILGLITLAAGLLIGWVISFFLPAEAQKVRSPEDAAADLMALLPWLLVVLIAQVPIFMAVWFAPALLVFRKMTAIDAIRWSFYACIANIGAFTVYGLASAGLFILASLPLGLGLIIMVPTLVASTYSSYRDIFVEEVPTSTAAL